MAYIINRFDGSELTVVDDGILDTTTSLGLVGRNYVGYGETQNENYVFLLENFSGNQPPARALSGQLWYDSSNKTIRVYNGITWNAVGNAQVQETEPTPSQGGLWLKSTTNQLFVSDGSIWRLVGPEAIEGFNTTKLTSRILRDAVGPSDRPVITVSINGEIIAIYSNSDFTIFGEDAVPGFGTLNKGLNFKTGFSVTGNLKGNADTATKFLTSRRINTVSFDGSSDITIKSSTTNKLNPGDYIVGAEWDGTVADTWDIDATPLNRVGKVVARDSNGAFSASIITADLVGNVTGNVTATLGTSTFSNIVVSQIIRGPTFTGNSATATRLQNPPTINTVIFDGTENITLPVPAETLVGETLAPNILSSSLRNLGKLEFLEIEAPGLKVGDGNDLSIFIEGFTPTIRSDVTDIIKFELFTGSTLRDKSDITFIAARTAETDGGGLSPALVPDWNKSVLDNQKISLGTPTHRWKNTFSQQFTGDTLNILQVTSIGAEVQFNSPIKADAGISGDLFGNVQGNVLGNVTGNLEGAASLNMLKSGDTMTGNLSWNIPSRGLTWSYDTDGASIKFYSSGEGDPNTRLEFNTSNNGTEYFLWTHTYESASTVNLMRLDANDNFGNIRLQLYGNIEASGKVQANNFVGDGSLITGINAANISSGRIANSRLTGSYDIDISGIANSVTSITSSQVVSALGYFPSNKAGDTFTDSIIVGSDTKTTDTVVRVLAGDTKNAGFEALGRSQGTGYLYVGQSTTYGGGVSYNGDSNPGLVSGETSDAITFFRRNAGTNTEVFFYRYDSDTVTFNGAITSTSFNGNGSNLTSLNASQLSSGTVPLSRLSGTYNISVSGNAATATTASTATNLSGGSINATIANFSGNITVAKSNPVINLNNTSDAGVEAAIGVYGENFYIFEPEDGSGYQSPFGGKEWMRIEDDASAYIFNSQVLTANNFTSYAPTKTGSGASGTWPISISGNAATVSAITNSQIINALGYTPVNPSSLSNQSGGAGNFSSVSASGNMTIDKENPTIFFNHRGDAGIELAMSVQGENMIFYEPEDSNREWFRINDDDAAYVFGDKVLDAGNYTSYAPTRTGGGASGTWPINISGTAAAVSSISSAQVTSALGYTPANGSGPGTINGDQNYQDYLLRRPTIIDYSLYHNALGSRTGSVTINCESGNYVSCTAAGAISFSFSNPASGQRATGIILELTNGGNYTITWPSSVRWPAGTAPTLTVSGVDVLVFITDDSGSTWRGAVSMSDSR